MSGIELPGFVQPIFQDENFMVVLFGLEVLPYFYAAGAVAVISFARTALLVSDEYDHSEISKSMFIFICMKKRLEITIPNPCTSSWNDMSHQSNGRFCASCEKEVIDFTGYSDAALQTWFLDRQNDKVCGRFTAKQLDELKTTNQKFKVLPRLYSRVIAACMLITPFTLKSAYGQAAKQHNVEVQEAEQNYGMQKVAEGRNASTDTLQTLSGIVVDIETKKALPGAKIRLKGTNKEIVADANGDFKIAYDPTTSPFIVVSLPGYLPLETDVKIKPGKPVTILLAADKSMVMGEVCIPEKSTYLRRLVKKSTH